MFLSSSSTCLLNVSVFFVLLPAEFSCLLSALDYRMFLSSSCSCLWLIPICIVCYLTCVPTCLHPPLYLPVWCSDLLNVLVKLISFLLPIAKLVCFFCVLSCLEFPADHWSCILPQAPAMRALSLPLLYVFLRLFHVSYLSLSLLITCNPACRCFWSQSVSSCCSFFLLHALSLTPFSFFDHFLLLIS